MSVSAVNMNNVPQVRFGNKYKEKQSHWFSGAIIGAAAGAAAGKFLPAMNPKINEGDVDTFVSTYKTLNDKKLKKEDTAFVKTLNEIYEPDYVNKQLLEKFGFVKDAEGKDITQISLYDLVKKNTNPGGQRYVLSQRLGQNENDIDLHQINPKEFDKAIVENEVKYYQGEVTNLEQKFNENPNNYNIKKELEQSKEALDEKRFVLSVAEKADGEGKIAKETIADLFKHKAGELVEAEKTLGCNIHRQRLSVIIKDLNRSKIKVMGVIGLVGGAIIGSLTKTEKAPVKK